MKVIRNFQKYYKNNGRIARISGKRCRVFEGEEIGLDIDIESLICPLRYDIRVRINFYNYYEQNRKLYENDLNSFLEGSPARAYYKWYKEDNLRLYRPKIYHQENRVNSYFLKKVKNAVKLFESIKQKGYDTTFPIRLKTGKTIIHENKKKLCATYYAGDGCHRLACLYCLGFKYLPKSHYIVTLRKKCIPNDSTHYLIRKIPLSTEEYFRFISSYYCEGREFINLQDIIDYLNLRRPDKLDEVLSVIHEDMKSFAEI